MRIGDDIVAEHRFDRGDRVTVGGGAADLVVPGLADSITLLEQGRVLPVPGLRDMQADADHTTLRVEAHPKIELDVRAETGPRPTAGRGLGLPWRELGYGSAVAACIIALLAVHSAASAAKAGGEGDEQGLIAREMMLAAPVQGPVARLAVGPSQPEPEPEPELELVPEPEPEPEPIPELDAEPEPTPEPTPKPKVKSAAKPAPVPVLGAEGEAAPVVGVGGQGTDSHTAIGVAEPKGEGKAAVDAKVVCKNPRSEPKDQVDVVFVVDVSTTMRFALDQLSREIARVDETLREYDEEPHYGLAIFVDDALLVSDGEPYTDVAALRRDFEHWAEFTSRNRQIGSTMLNTDWPENSLDALHLAATDFKWRDADDTLRVIVHATDDDFGEGGTTFNSGLPIEHTYADTVEALKANHVRVATFTAPIGGQCECLDVKPGFMSDYNGQDSIPNATGGAAFDIDEVARGRLHIGEALTDLVENLVCD